jgi:hypothetical protein
MKLRFVLLLGLAAVAAYAGTILDNFNRPNAPTSDLVGRNKQAAIKS